MNYPAHERPLRKKRGGIRCRFFTWFCWRVRVRWASGLECVGRGSWPHTSRTSRTCHGCISKNHHWNEMPKRTILYCLNSTPFLGLSTEALIPAERTLVDLLISHHRVHATYTASEGKMMCSWSPVACMQDNIRIKGFDFSGIRAEKESQLCKGTRQACTVPANVPSPPPSRSQSMPCFFDECP